MYMVCVERDPQKWHRIDVGHVNTYLLYLPTLPTPRLLSGFPVRRGASSWCGYCEKRRLPMDPSQTPGRPQALDRLSFKYFLQKFAAESNERDFEAISTFLNTNVPILKGRLTPEKLKGMFSTIEIAAGAQRPVWNSKEMFLPTVSARR